ncbi:MAG TPA: phage recombination protein Bet [Candidatus Binatia bacterium]|nr:phage recombination protein Bet [Candidatus Binatia bacterium]
MMNAVVQFNANQVELIRKTVAKDANQTEFDLFVEMCKARGLNPLIRHAYCFVFHKDKADKRQMVVVVSREGQRAIAERTGNYRPDERAPRYTSCTKDAATNPHGIESAEVSVYKHSHGEWFPVTEVAYWDEYAPVVQVWENGQRTDKVQLDPKKDGWRKMPRIMLAKCAEMAALRKAFPDDFGGLYGEGELDRGEILDLTPSEMADKSAQENRLAMIGGPDTYIIDWLDGHELQNVPGGKFGDQLMAFIASCKDEPSTVRAWMDRNRHSFRQFWAAHKSEALELNKALEAASKPASGAQIDLAEAIAEQGAAA